MILGALPLGAAGFLAWMFTESVQSAPAQEVWSLVGIICAGVLLLAAARFVLRSPFFQIKRESETL